MKPEYLFRPVQLWHRLRRSGPRPPTAAVTMPWGLPMTVRPGETVGHALWHLGVLDLAVTEVLWRLTDPGAVVVDAGANIGYYAGLLSVRAGPGGRVIAYEPHPGIASELRGHLAQWAPWADRMAPVEVREAALSDRDGSAELFEPEQFDRNRGAASLETVSSETGEANAIGTRRWPVDVRRLDRGLEGVPRVDLLKVDVEGHELALFDGAGAWIGEGRIRDILFEEHHAFPSPAMERLLAAGYRLFLVGRGFSGPRLLSPEILRDVPSWLPPNLLATRDPERALAACRPGGWRCLRGGGFRTVRG